MSGMTEPKKKAIFKAADLTLEDTSFRYCLYYFFLFTKKIMYACRVVVSWFKAAISIIPVTKTVSAVKRIICC